MSGPAPGQDVIGTAGDPEIRAPVGAWFGQCFGRPAEVAWRAPGRVNLIGEHTDYNDGLVLPFALGVSVTAAAAARDDGLVELRSRQMPDEIVSVRLGDLKPGSVTGWAAYPAGAAWALREAGSGLAGASVAIDSDLPQGAGLASSAALECAVAACLADLAGLHPSRPELAALARRAENDFVGMPCGIMDQSAVMFCVAGHALLLDCRTGDHAAVPLDPAAAGLSLMIIDTGVRHELVGGEYAVRRQECERAARALGVASLRDVDDTAGLAVLADPLLARRARHVVTENRRVEQVAGLLREVRLAGCGPLLTQSHRSLRDDFGVSWREADAAVDAALAAGALGARMTGAGFGGCVLALLPVDRAAQVKAGVLTALGELGGPGPAFIDAVPGQGARRLRLG
ncbi:MAG TPA: galactokinase [Streptosporangiaceae bacterium]|nr:galactokinase [Streptosporangiaceae bacterium]